MVLGMDEGMVLQGRLDVVARFIGRTAAGFTERRHHASRRSPRNVHKEDGMIVLTAKYVAKTGKGDEVEGLLRRMGPLVTANEPGCRLYHANRSTDNPDIFLLYEHYADQAALDAHRTTPHFKEIIEGVIVPLLEKRERALYQSVVA
jgi:quinol monooxygenase YgiN